MLIKIVIVQHSYHMCTCEMMFLPNGCNVDNVYIYVHFMKGMNGRTKSKKIM